MKNRNRITVDLSEAEFAQVERIADAMGLKPPSLLRLALKTKMQETEESQAFTIPFARRAQPEAVEGGRDEQ